MLRRILRDYRRLHWSLKRYFLRRARRLSAEQEVEETLERLNREQAQLRRITWRR